jgi:hypothetical protein
MRRLLVLAFAAASLVAVVAAPLVAGDGARRFSTKLTGFNEVPSLSTAASGSFSARIDGDRVHWRLSYRNLEGDITQAHIHVGQAGVNGGISVFFCTNLGNGPAGTPACPPSPAEISGTFTAADVIGPTAQGVAPGEFAELVRAIRGGVTYANVHSTKFPGGEIRGRVVRSDDD